MLHKDIDGQEMETDWDYQRVIGRLII